MRCLTAFELGSPENFTFEEVPDPHPGPGQVRIRVHTVALGFVDGLIAAGRYQMAPTLPFTPGGEISGIVDMVGPGVHDLEEGARVVTWQLGGGLAESIVVSSVEIDIVPDELDLVTAAAVLVDYQTARYALIERGRLKAGETVLVAGALGGVGSAAIQIAFDRGASVIALVTDPASNSRALELGALAAVSPTDPHLRDELKRLAPGGIDVVVDPIGASLSETLFRSLAKEGRHLVIGFAAGSIPAIPSNLALLKSASLVGVDLRYYAAAYPAAAKNARSEIFEKLVARTLKPPRLMPFVFEQAREALVATSLRSKSGKPVVQLASPSPE